MFELLDFCDFLTSGKVFSDFPTLQEYYNRVKSLPGMAEYYADDDKCMKVPFNNPIAKINNFPEWWCNYPP